MTPPLCRTCPVAIPVLVGLHCPHLAGPLSIRRAHHTCRVPRDQWPRLVRELAASDGRRARLLAERWGLDYAAVIAIGWLD